MADAPAQSIRPRDRARTYDIVVWGATGFTGRLVAEYLARNYSDGSVRWAIAGRNQAKLDSIIEIIEPYFTNAHKPGVLLGDSMDRASMDELAKSTSVVLTTVGPYAKFGENLVAACVDNGTDYCDLTGEVQFIRRMIDAHHDKARATGTRIVHCCGFDSIPSDIGTWYLQELARQESGAPCDEVKLHVVGASGGFSGGTVASLLNVLDEARDKSVRRILGHPYSLNPEGERSGPDGGDQNTARRDETTGAWTAPFVMAAINTRVVRRSNALRDFVYGREFRYSEVTRTGKGAKGFIAAATTAAGLGGFVAAATIPPLRRLMEQTVLPAPGEGPTRKQIQRGWFKIELVGTWDSSDRDPLRVSVHGKRDPGYGATACMLAESALCLALDGGELESEGGVLTPAVAMGGHLMERLNATQVTFART